MYIHTILKPLDLLLEKQWRPLALAIGIYVTEWQSFSITSAKS